MLITSAKSNTNLKTLDVTYANSNTKKSLL